MSHATQATCFSFLGVGIDMGKDIRSQDDWLNSNHQIFALIIKFNQAEIIGIR